MNQAEFDRVVGELFAVARAIETSKRPGYTVGADDVLANFKRCGERAGISTEQAWTVFFLKHIDAITSIMTRPDLPVSEAAEGRFADAINYLRLGWAIYRERCERAASEQRSQPVSDAAQESARSSGDYGQYVPAQKMGAR